MKKNVFVLAILCCMTLMANAGVAKYCMSYSDFVAGKWKSVDELSTANQAVQIKAEDNQVRFKTGDKAADEVLKKEAFAVMYGDNLYVNCHNLRNDGISLDITGYTQAVRYDRDKVCVMAYKDNTLTSVLGLGLSVASIFVDNTAVRIGMNVGAAGCDVSNEYLSGAVCYLVDHDADEKGKIATTRIDDNFMEQLLHNDANLLKKYNAISSKHNRQAAANVLPILMEKGLVKTNALN